MGQVNRVDSCRLAVERAGERAAGSVAASDAFFPFADGLQILIDAGVRAIVQPGGSVRDEEVVAAAQAAGRDDVLHRHPALLPLSGPPGGGPGWRPGTSYGACVGATGAYDASGRPRGG